MIQFNKEIISNLDAATSREWLETNGLGGFSSSTIIGLNTRRYHGLLTAATKPPVGRIVMFIVARGAQKTVIAGYHWFSDWGRDTMIALPGLTLASGRPEIARSILSEFSQHVDQGVLVDREVTPSSGSTSICSYIFVFR